MRVLLAVDGSVHALRAAQFLVRLVSGQASMELLVLNVQPHVPYVALLENPSQEQVEQLQHERGRELAAPACLELERAALPFELHVVSDDAARAIVHFAREHGCDLIVMGTRGMGTVAGLALGSVALKVIHLTNLPVTLVR